MYLRDLILKSTTSYSKVLIPKIDAWNTKYDSGKKIQEKHQNMNSWHFGRSFPDPFQHHLGDPQPAGEARELRPEQYDDQF